LGRHGDFLLTRDKSNRWRIRTLSGRFVKKDVQRAQFKRIFGRKKPKGKVVRYTRTFLFEEPVGKGGALTPTTKADVIVEDVEPLDFSEDDQARKLKSREMRKRMTDILRDSDEFKGKFGGELPRFKTWGGTEVRDKRTVREGFVDDFRAWTRGGK